MLICQFLNLNLIFMLFHAVSCCSMQQENLCSFSVSYHVFLFPFLNDTSWMDDRIGMMGSFQKMGTRASLPPFEL